MHLLIFNQLFLFTATNLLCICTTFPVIVIVFVHCYSLWIKSSW